MDLKALKKEFLDDRLHSYDGSTLDATAHMLFELNDPSALMQVATRFIGQRLSACRADVGLATRRDKVYSSQVEWLSSSSDPPSMKAVELPNQSRVIQRVWKCDRPVAYSDCYTGSEFESMREGMLKTRTRSLIARRLEFNDETFGLICIDQTTHARQWETGTLEYLDLFGATVLSPLLHMSAALSLQARPSPAELDAIRLAARGLSYKQIAKQLGKSVRTIEHQLRHARQRMDASNQADLIMKCSAWL